MKFTCHYINVDIYICVKNRKKKQICAQVPSAYLEYYSVVLHPVVEADTERVVTREIGALTHQEEAVLAGHQDLLRHLSGYLAMKPGHLHRLGRHFAVLGTVAADLFALHTLLHEMNFEKKLALSTYLRKEVLRVAKGAQRANCHIEQTDIQGVNQILCFFSKILKYSGLLTFSLFCLGVSVCRHTPGR